MRPESAAAIIQRIATQFAEAQDNLTVAKANQAASANKKRAAEHEEITEGSRVMLSTYHRRREYVSSDEERAAKFFPRFDVPYVVTKAHPERSTYTLDIPNAASNACLTFHSSLLKPYKEPDPTLAPDHVLERPGPVENGEHLLRDIVAERRRGRGKQYKVRWVGYGDTDMEWLPGSALKDNAVLDAWEARKRNLTHNGNPDSADDNTPVAVILSDDYYPPRFITD